MSSVTSSTHCDIFDFRLNVVHNFTKLSLDRKEDIVIEHDNEKIRMQLCSPLIKKCNNQDGYSICLIKNNTEKGIGNCCNIVQTTFYLLRCYECDEAINFVDTYRKVVSKNRLS